MRLVWLPKEYDAAFAITDDPDQGSFDQFKKMYDLLLRLHLPTSRAMWVFPPEEQTGTPPLTIKFFAPLLGDPRCLEYCKELHQNGFEICLHGASSGNNTRQRTIAALDFLEREIGHSRTYIFHSKNAENLYWDHKCAPTPILSALVRLYTKNACFGEVEKSRYFWGDIAKSKLKYFRLFRTRQLNTLAFNPSMPYHNFSMPFINYWFSATKGYLPRLLHPEAINDLCRSHGAGVLYQYLHKYVDEKGNVDPRVRECLEGLAANPRILFVPVSTLMDRLKQFQLLFLVSCKGEAFVINASQNKVDSVQLAVERDEAIGLSSGNGINTSGRKAVIGSIPPMSVHPLCSIGSLKLAPLQQMKMHSNIAEIRFPLGTVVANFSARPAEIADGFERLRKDYPMLKRLEGFEVKVYFSSPEAQRLEILNPISKAELKRLFFGQAKVLLREHLFLGRKISAADYLEKPGKVEDQTNW
jgi:hypothetical protein